MVNLDICCKRIRRYRKNKFDTRLEELQVKTAAILLLVVLFTMLALAVYMSWLR